MLTSARQRGSMNTSERLTPYSGEKYLGVSFMSSWWPSVLPAGVATIVYLIGSGSQPERNAAIRQHTTTAQVRRAIDLERSITRLRPQRWYDSALAYAIFGTPLCQWLIYQYTGSASAVILPLVLFVVLHVGINGFHPYSVPHTPLQFRQYVLRIGVLGSVLALAIFVPSSPGMIATKVALLDMIGLLAAGAISSAIRSAWALDPIKRQQ